MAERYSFAQNGFGLATLKSEGEAIPYDPAYVVERDPNAPDPDYVQVGGRPFYANRGIIGLDPDGNAFGGYDGGFGPDVGEFTADERRELAEMMIARWRKFGGL
jgi:hypothetical protein